jgi:hypothetical protein
MIANSIDVKCIHLGSNKIHTTLMLTIGIRVLCLSGKRRPFDLDGRGYGHTGY